MYAMVWRAVVVVALVGAGCTGGREGPASAPAAVGTPPATRNPATGRSGAAIEPGHASGDARASTGPGEGSEADDGQVAPSGCPSRLLPIHEIQGVRHRSPFEGREVLTGGVVTAVTSDGFFLQDPHPDALDSTSEGLFVLSEASVTVGSALEITGRVQERGIGTELPVTRLVAKHTTESSTEQPLPSPVIVGMGGRQPPTELLYEGGGRIDADRELLPERNGLDFWESLEGMRVELRGARVVAGRNRFGEIGVVTDLGRHATGLTTAGNLLRSATDPNPELVLIDDALVPSEPAATTGDAFTAPIVALVTYAYGAYRVINPEPLPPLQRGGRHRDTTSLVGTSTQLTVASWNVFNLSPFDTEQLARQGELVVHQLRAPDVLALQEVQDSDGDREPETSVVDADLTLQALVEAIGAAGGPRYDAFDLDPIAPGANGGAPGSNIRPAVLVRADRVTLVGRGTPTPRTPATVVELSGAARLETSPSSIAPDSFAFARSRKPLVAELDFAGTRLFLVNVHLKSKSGDDSVAGVYQPPRTPSEARRVEQARLVHDFVASLLAAEPQARVLVVGDMNDFEYSPTLATLAGSLLTHLTAALPPEQRYSYLFNGSGQLLDHALVSNSLAATAEVQVVHTCLDFGDSSLASDHDPVVVRVTP